MVPSADGDLSGYAWGENVGWINFDHAQCDAAINPANGEFSGHAWGENIGWLKFKGTTPDYGVRSMAFYTQPQGTPNWWLEDCGKALWFLGVSSIETPVPSMTLARHA